MSRHRHIRSMNFADEYDLYEDFYGHLDSYVKEDDNSAFSSEPHEIDDEKLTLCRESIGDLLEEVISETELLKMIPHFNYNSEALIQAVLNLQDEGKKIQSLSDSKFKNILNNFGNETSFNKMNVNVDKKSNSEKDCESEETEKFSSLSEMISNITKPLETNSSINCSRPSAPDLSDYYSKKLDKKTVSHSRFVIPKMNFKTSKPTCSNSDTSSFNSLSDLTDHYLNISPKNKEDNGKFVGSPFRFNTSTIPFKITKSDDTTNNKSDDKFDSLHSLTEYHLKIFNDNENNKNSSSSSDISNNNIKCDNTNSINNLSIIDSNPEKIIVPNFDFMAQNTSKIEQGNSFVNEGVQNISNLTLNEMENSKSVIQPDNILNLYNENTLTNPLELTKQAIKDEYMSHYKSNKNFKILRKSVSPFGKVLCKMYKTSKNYRMNEEIKVSEKLKILLRFDFSSPSPYILKRDYLKNNKI